MTRSARLAAAVLAAGCADRRQTLPAVAESPVYRAGCGDVLAVRVGGRPGLDGVGCVAADGALPLGPLGRVPADQQSLDQIRAAVAVVAGVPAEAVAITAEPRAGVVYLRAPGGRLTAVPFVGDESVAGFLRRAGFTRVGPVTVTRPVLDGSSRPFPVVALDAVTVAAGDTVSVGGK